MVQRTRLFIASAASAPLPFSLFLSPPPFSVPPSPLAPSIYALFLSLAHCFPFGPARMFRITPPGRAARCARPMRTPSCRRCRAAQQHGPRGLRAVAWSHSRTAPRDDRPGLIAVHTEREPEPPIRTAKSELSANRGVAWASRCKVEQGAEPGLDQSEPLAAAGPAAPLGYARQREATRGSWLLTSRIPSGAP